MESLPLGKPAASPMTSMQATVPPMSHPILLLPSRAFGGLGEVVNAAASAMLTMTAAPVSISSSSKVKFSLLKVSARVTVVALVSVFFASSMMKSLVLCLFVMVIDVVWSSRFYDVIANDNDPQVNFNSSLCLPSEWRDMSKL